MGVVNIPRWLYSENCAGDGVTSLRFRSWGSRYTVLHVIQMKAGGGWSVWMISALNFTLTTGPEDPVAEGRVSVREACRGFRSRVWHFKSGRAIELAYAPEAAS